MNDLQARKNLLLSKAALQRLRLRNDADTLRQSLTPKAMLSKVGAGGGAALLLSGVLAFLARGRLKGVAGGALGAISLIKTVMALVARFRA